MEASGSSGEGQSPTVGEQAAQEVHAARLAAIAESSDEAIIAKSLDGTILSWNAAAERLYGYSVEEVVGRHISLLVPQENSGEVDFILEQIRAGVAVVHHETVRVGKDGRRIDLSLPVSPVRDRNGFVVGASTIARDVSERKRAEEIMARQAAALKEQADLLDLTHDSIIVRDLEDTIRLWNAGAEATYGWTRNEAVATRHTSCFAPSSLSRWTRSFTQCWRAVAGRVSWSTTPEREIASWWPAAGRFAATTTDGLTPSSRSTTTSPPENAPTTPGEDIGLRAVE